MFEVISNEGIKVTTQHLILFVIICWVICIPHPPIALRLLGVFVKTECIICTFSSYGAKTHSTLNQINGIAFNQIESC